MAPDGRSKGFAFVEFTDDQDEGKTSDDVAKDAIASLDGTE